MLHVVSRATKVWGHRVLSMFDVCKVFVEAVARILATIVVPCRRCQPTALQDMALAHVAMNCNECHEVDGEAVPGAVFRCKDCNALKSRIHRLFKKPGMEKIEEVFKAMTKDEQESSSATSMHSCGDGLAAVMKTLVIDDDDNKFGAVQRVF